MEPETLEEQVRVDVGGFFRVVQAALAHLRESGGSIVAVTTAATSRYPVRDGLSAVPKGAVEASDRAGFVSGQKLDVDGGYSV